jgi:hypothetical protein
VQKLLDMLHGHVNHGIAAWHGAVHVFGSSFKKEARVCERLGMKEMRWELLPEMNKHRSGLTPAIWLNAIYLCGGGPPSIEVYDGHSMVLLTLKLLDARKMFACASENSLFIFSFDHFSIVSKSSRSKTLSLDWKMKRGEGPQATPAVWGNQIVTFTINSMHWDDEYFDYPLVTRYSTTNECKIAT